MLFILSGISVFITEPDIITGGIISIGIGVFLIYRSRKEKTMEPKDADIDPVDPVKTFSFQATGFRFDCRFPSGRFHNRQILTAHCRVEMPLLCANTNGKANLLLLLLVKSTMPILVLFLPFM